MSVLEVAHTSPTIRERQICLEYINELSTPLNVILTKYDVGFSELYLLLEKYEITFRRQKHGRTKAETKS